MTVYMEMPLLFTVETSGCGGSIPSPSTGEGGGGGAFHLLLSPFQGMTVNVEDIQ